MNEPSPPPDPFETILSGEYGALRPDTDFQKPNRAELYRLIHAQAKPLSALCISGGGIRSATFALGAIQGLAELGILQEFDYMSTVSGGGYIGGWLTAWIQRAAGISNVIPHLKKDAPPIPPGEADPIQHLREYNNYLTPKLGAFSGDTWTLASTIIRNVFLNWLVLIPLFLSALVAPRLVLSVFDYAELNKFVDSVTVNPWAVYGLPLLAGSLFIYSMFSTLRYLPGVGNRSHTQADFVRNVLGPLVAASLFFCACYSLTFSSEPDPLAEMGWMLTPCSGAWALYLVFCGKPFKERLRLLISHLSLAIALLGLGTGAAAWVLTHYLFDNTTWPQYVTVGPPLLLFGFAVAGAIFVGLSSRVLKDEDREWLSRAAARLLLFCLIWLVGCALVLIVPTWAFGWPVWGKSVLSAVGVIAAASSSLAGFRGSYTRPGQTTTRPKTSLSSVVLKVAPAVFTLSVTVGLAILTNIIISAISKHPLVWWSHDQLLTHTTWKVNLELGAAFFLLSWTMARYVNINVFSLEGMYRNRLIRAYLGASNSNRKANKFTGFSQSDNFSMHELDARQRPFHVVNLTLNLVKGDRLAWQQRKAESFTVSPLHCGSAQLGYRSSVDYGGKHGISLGTAITISGAAASPNMGYHSSPLIGLIMTLFNVRLGAWLGNPGKANSIAWKEESPRSAIGSLVKEAFGLTSDRSDYVYLSDGGHFENLGIYEMLLRRCHTIVVLDAGCDEFFTYDDLGNALRKIRIDMKIPITFTGEANIPSAKPTKRCVTATLHYSAVDGLCPDGELIYIKPMILGDESPDVATYHASHKSFPHQSTEEQWFDESQTESYRMLGLHTVDQIFCGWTAAPLKNLRRHVETEYLKIPVPVALSKTAEQAG